MLFGSTRISPRSANQVRRTFGFIDLSGFTGYVNERGDDRAVEQLSYFRAIVRSVCSETGVRIAKWLGDGAMLVALEPVAMAATVLTIMERFDELEVELALHGGLVEGEVILFEGDDHIGVSVNLAARLADVAKPGQVLTPANFLPGLSHSVAVIGPTSVAGFEHPIEVANIVAAHALVAALNR